MTDVFTALENYFSSWTETEMQDFRSWEDIPVGTRFKCRGDNNKSVYQWSGQYFFPIKSTPVAIEARSADFFGVRAGAKPYQVFANGRLSSDCI